MDLNVGQIIYLLSNKGDNIYPAQIVEKIKRKTLHDEITSYIACLPDEGSTKIPLDEINASIYTSMSDVKTALLEAATTRINKLITNSKKLESRFSAIKDSSRDNAISSDITNSVVAHEGEDDNIAIVDLGDGNVAKINVSDIPV